MDLPDREALGQLAREHHLHYDVERDAAGCPNLTLSVVEGAGHLFEEPGKLEEALQRTVDWFTRQLAAAPSGSYVRQAG